MPLALKSHHGVDDSSRTDVVTRLRISRRLVQCKSVQRDDFFPDQPVGGTPAYARQHISLLDVLATLRPIRQHARIPAATNLGELHPFRHDLDRAWTENCRHSLTDSPRSRTEAIELIEPVLERAIRSEQRVLLCFDFAYGYPVDFAPALQAATGKSDRDLPWLTFGNT